MDLGRHHIRKGLVDHAVPLQPAATGKCLRLDPDDEVPGTAPCTRMARVPGTVILHGDLCRREG